MMTEAVAGYQSTVLNITKDCEIMLQKINTCRSVAYIQ